jgi:molybdenum cofactor biosynthesis protein B
MSESVAEHQARARRTLKVLVVTVSDTRTSATDISGGLIERLTREAGHEVTGPVIVPDEPARIRSLVEQGVAEGFEAILLTGGTGVSPRDRTPEALEPLFTLQLPGFGELFRYLSHAQIGPACMLSRAIGGLVGKTVVLAMPGSRAAVELAMAQIILPELPHLVCLAGG